MGNDGFKYKTVLGKINALRETQLGPKVERTWASGYGNNFDKLTAPSESGYSVFDELAIEAGLGHLINHR